MINSTRPMDRLVCGDVGFGKTEVAIRAIYRAVLSKKQVRAFFHFLFSQLSTNISRIYFSSPVGGVFFQIEKIEFKSKSFQRSYTFDFVF